MSACDRMGTGSLFDSRIFRKVTFRLIPIESSNLRVVMAQPNENLQTKRECVALRG